MFPVLVCAAPGRAGPAACLLATARGGPSPVREGEPCRQAGTNSEVKDEYDARALGGVAFFIHHATPAASSAKREVPDASGALLPEAVNAPGGWWLQPARRTWATQCHCCSGGNGGGRAAHKTVNYGGCSRATLCCSCATRSQRLYARRWIDGRSVSLMAPAWF